VEELATIAGIGGYASADVYTARRPL